MPTYDYRCRKCGHQFELFHGIKDDKPKRCPRCKGRAVKVPSAGAGILFKGSGFYITDYRSSEYNEKAKQEKPAAEKPGADKPAAEKPAAEKPASGGESKGKAGSAPKHDLGAKPASGGTSSRKSRRER